jgi:hypothetical protein
MSINKCPADRLRSFPVDAGFLVSENTYKRASKTPMNIKFTWGTRTTAPNFSYAGSGEFDHTQNDYGTSLKYNGALYTLGSAQFTSPTHNSWLQPSSLGATKLDNVEDVVITFQRDMYDPGRRDDPKIIILVNPILRNDTQNGNPVYLTNMANGIASPVTLESIFPYVAGNNYAYYMTCADGLTSKDPYKNILVLLNVQGALVSTSLMEKIKAKYNSFSEGDYPGYVPLANFIISPNPNKSVRNILEGFQMAGVTTPPNIPASTATAATAAAAAAAAAKPRSGYTVDKCVPFDPETQVGSDGIIVLDKNNNPQTLPEILNKRDAIKSEYSWNQTGTVPMTRIEIAFIYLFIGVIITCIIAAVANNLESVWGAQIVFKVATSIVFGIIPFIAGFVLGIFVIPAKCPACPMPPSSNGGV